MIALLVPGRAASYDRVPPDSLPRITLAEATPPRGVRLDPDYVRSLGSDRAAPSGAGRAADARLRDPVGHRHLPTTRSSRRPSSTSAPANPRVPMRASGWSAPLELFSGGGSSPRLPRAKAELEGARATESWNSAIRAALDIESAYYHVLGSRELREVARGRGRRAVEAAQGRARPGRQSGAAVQIRLAAARARAQPRRGSIAPPRRGTRSAPAGSGSGGSSGERGAVDAVPLDTRRRPRSSGHPAGRGDAGARAGPGVAGRPRRRAPGEARSSRRGRAPTCRRSRCRRRYSVFDDELFPNASERQLGGLQRCPFRSGTTATASSR